MRNLAWEPKTWCSWVGLSSHDGGEDKKGEKQKGGAEGEEDAKVEIKYNKKGRKKFWA